MSRCLVTGGAGFIGSTLAKRLLSRGDDVTILDNLSAGKVTNIPDGAEFIHGDLSSITAFDKMDGRGFDAVFHLGSQASGELSYEQPMADFETNARGTLLLLQWCRRSEIERIIFSSSRVVYADSVGPIPENYPTKPQSYYGAAKLAGEAYMNLYHRIGGKPTIFRFFNVYGPRQNLENLKQGMASIYLVYIFRGEPVLVKGSLDRYRDFVYVDDVANALIAALENTTVSSGQTYNIGTGKKTTVRELISIMLRAFGHDPNTYPVDVVGGTPGDVPGSIADIRKVTEELSWSPCVDVVEGIRRTAEWAKGLRRAN